jgi:hypothetical protein
LAGCEGAVGDPGSDAAVVVVVAVVGSSVAPNKTGTPVSPTAIALATAAPGVAGEGALCVVPSNTMVGGVVGEGAVGKTLLLTPAEVAPPLTSAGVAVGVIGPSTGRVGPACSSAGGATSTDLIPRAGGEGEALTVGVVDFPTNSLVGAVTDAVVTSNDATVEVGAVSAGAVTSPSATPAGAVVARDVSPGIGAVWWVAGMESPVARVGSRVPNAGGASCWRGDGEAVGRMVLASFWSSTVRRAVDDVEPHGPSWTPTMSLAVQP